MTESEQQKPRTIETQVISLLRKKPLSKAEISQHLGHQHLSGALKKVFQNLIERDIVSYTIPDKPRSKLQKYKFNEKHLK